MNLAFAHTRSTIGINASPVTVEVFLSNGLPNLNIVGLPETAIKESKDRVRSAICNSHYDFPRKRITVSLAPADLPKSGSGFDLPIALGILAASGQIPIDALDSHEFIGELALNGVIRSVSTIIPVVLACKRADNTLVISHENAMDAALAGYDKVFSARNLREVCAYLCKEKTLTPLPSPPDCFHEENALDWSDVKGQSYAKQAMEIAAAGGHSVLLCGPPGSGKTMLAKRFSTLLPSLSEEQALETAAIHSLKGKPPNYKHWRRAPFRSPHHTASPVALVGGGSPPKPGEISLAHHGVLFLDELPEFHRHVLETLREPLESGNICISRASMQVDYPAQFQFIAAMNPCPCGHWGNPHAECICSPDKINRYMGKLSAPLLDRIDMHISVEALPREELIKAHAHSEAISPSIREQVERLHDKQIQRQSKLNAKLEPKECEYWCQLSEEEYLFLEQAMQRLNLSARAYHRLLKVARTIADIKDSPKVQKNHLAQAMAYKESFKRI